MQVIVNGSPRVFDPGITVADVLASLGLDAGRTIVEYNRAVLPRDAFATTRLSEGDNLELVEIVGGG